MIDACPNCGCFKCEAARALLRPKLSPLPRLLLSTAIESGVPVEQLKGEGQTRPLVRARWIVMLLARELHAVSYPRIGRALGDRDHSTVIHGERQARRLRTSDAGYRDLVDRVAARMVQP